jgi:hypothetical protein
VVRKPEFGRWGGVTAICGAGVLPSQSRLVSGYRHFPLKTVELFLIKRGLIIQAACPTISPDGICTWWFAPAG